MSLIRSTSRNNGLKTFQDLYAETRRKRRKTREASAVADELEKFQDAQTWPKTRVQLPSDIQHAVKKRNRSDAYNLECINSFTLITIFAGLSAAGVVACLGTVYTAGLGFGPSDYMKVEWLVPFVVLSTMLLCSLCCCARFKATVESDLEPHIQVLQLHSVLYLEIFR
jgi:hypothetical protein